MTKAELWKANNIDLTVIANKYDLKIDASKKINRKALIDAILIAQMEAGTGTKVLVEDDAGVEEVNARDAKVPGKMVIFHQIRENDAPSVFVGHNAKSWYLPKNKPVWVPDFILNSCIKDAVIDSTKMVTHQDGSIEYIIEPIMRFPYSVQDEADFQKKV